MQRDSYAAKDAYQGEVVAHYESDRVVEPLWQLEQDFIRSCCDRIPSGAVVADVPVGTGRFLPFYTARALAVHGFDISLDMIAEAARKCAGSGTEMHLSVGDAEKLPLADQSVDVLVSWRFFHLIPLATIDRVLAEFCRVCRGQMIIQVLPVRQRGLAVYAPGWLKAVLRPVRRCLAGKKQTPWSHIPSYLHAERDLLRLFARHRLDVRQAMTLADYQGFPVRIYTLAAMASKT